jgi:hypothetical protein
MGLLSNLTVQLQIAQTKALSLLTTTGAAQVSKTYLTDLTDGTGAGKADLVFHGTRTIGGAPDDLDLAGSLTDAFGTVLTFAKVKSITIVTYSTNAANVVIGNAAANQFQGPFGAVTHTIAIKPGGKFHLDVGKVDLGYAVTAGTGDVLRFAGTNGDKYDVIIVGSSA